MADRISYSETSIVLHLRQKGILLYIGVTIHLLRSVIAFSDPWNAVQQIGS